MVGGRKFIFIFGILFLDGLLVASELPKPLQEVRPPLISVGSASLHWFGIHVYDIALYAEDKNYTTNGAAVISICYNISVKHRRLQKTTLKEWQRMGKGSAEQHEQWINQLDALWPDIKSGERLSAYRQSDGPTQFYFGDRLLGEVADKAFGPAFFSIWLDSECRYPEIRDKILKSNQAIEKRKIIP